MKAQELIELINGEPLYSLWDADDVIGSEATKVAGNSIVVDVLYHIFRQAFTSDRDTNGAVVDTIKVDVQQLKLFEL